MNKSEPKGMQFIRAQRAEMRNADAELRATKLTRPERLTRFIQRTKPWLDRLLDMPIVQAVLLLALYGAAVGSIAWILGWHP